uniref:Uncharacterized protein n=1 Tax=Morchella brunnea TaxID=1174671 RepID=A0A8K1MGD1_9PEZI|nr:hypothetical protein LK370_mgp079 [Morchella brunnea]UBU98403.1 hypothetical protein [Morchella brunnea]
MQTWSRDDLRSRVRLIYRSPFSYPPRLPDLSPGEAHAGSMGFPYPHPSYLAKAIHLLRKWTEPGGEGHIRGGGGKEKWSRSWEGRPPPGSSLIQLLHAPSRTALSTRGFQPRVERSLIFQFSLLFLFYY